MDLWLDGGSRIEEHACDDCGAAYLLVRSFVLDAVGPHAFALTALHDHGGPEAWMDVAFGSFDGGASREERTTFGCRVGQVVGSDEPAATAVAAALPYPDSPTLGRKLSREEALAHPRIADFWAVVDLVLVHEPSVNHHLYGHGGPARQA